jgi:hypothetical protein
MGQEFFEDESMNKTIPIPSREQVTQHQIGTVLSSIATLVPFFQLIRYEDDDSLKDGPLDGGTKVAIQTTLIKACDRLDKILDDDARWSLDTTRTLETHLSGLYHEHAKLIRLQQQQIYNLNLPHVRHNPALGRLTDGSWIAFLGDLDDINNAVVGVGGSPAQALEAFDEMFNGRIPSHLTAWMEVREEALKNGLQPPTKSEYDQKQTMDRAGSGDSTTHEGDGRDLRDDSENFGPDEEGDGTQGGSSAQS